MLLLKVVSTIKLRETKMAFKVKDYYYNKAKKENFLARSIFKLEEIDLKYKVIKATSNVLDLGYYPGSWVQYVSRKAVKGKVVGIDIQPINKTLSALKNVSLFEKDIMLVAGLEELGVEDKFDVLLSDMAPKTSGIKIVDQSKSLELIEMVFSLLPNLLKVDGNLVIKVFDGHSAQEFLKGQRKNFREFNYLKPKSTRSTSKEFFLIAKGFIRE